MPALHRAGISFLDQLQSERANPQIRFGLPPVETFEGRLCSEW